MAEKFLIIDGSSLIHRAFFALPQLMNSKGLHTGAVYGFCNMLVRLLEENKPAYVAVAFDKSRKTFRTELYADYKGQRKPTPSELSEQFPLAADVLRALNIKSLELQDYEADDIIGTLAKHAPAGMEVIVVTGDKDELQLIDERTKVFYTKRGITDIKVYDTEAFAADYEGLSPAQIIDLKGLMGDASDNIPGVPGVGPKTALKLIKEYGDVASVLENIDRIDGKALKNKLMEHKDSALLSKRLATICTDVPMATEPELYKLSAVGEKARLLLQELEFRNMFERFAAALGSETELLSLFAAEEEPAAPQIAIADAAAAASLAAKLADEKTQVALAVRIGGTLPEMYFEELEIFCGGSLYVVAKEQCPYFYGWLADEHCLKVVCGAKDIYKTCLCLGVVAAGIAEDVSLGAYLVDPGHSSYELDALAERFLNKSCGSDGEKTAALNEVLRERLASLELLPLYRELELPLASLLARMEFAGIAPDTELLQQLRDEMALRIEQLERLAEEQAGESFNLKSTKQLGTILFEKLQLPVLKKTKTGYSTDVSVLEKLEGMHPLVGTLLEHRKLAKLQSTYLEGLLPLVNSSTGRIHTHFQQTVTVTGRLSSTDPNLQNIPARTEEGRQIRRVFVPGAGYDLLLSCDYSQVELRILACIAGDELLLEAFRSGQDIHARTAAEVFGVGMDEVTPILRGRAKAVNFGIVYGISDFGLAKQLNVTRNEAAGYIKNYFERYKGVKAYMENIVIKAREQGYVSTLMGRRRYLPDIRHSNFNLRSFAERTAINTPIQGSAADIMKKAMLDVSAKLDASGLHSRLLLQVHDELVLEVTEAELEPTAELVRSAMEQAVTLDIPLLADVNWGKNWAETK